MFKTSKDSFGYINAILLDDKVVLHLNSGTEINEKNAELIVKILNQAVEMSHKIIGDIIERPK